MAVRRSSSLLIAEERESSCICRSSSNWLTASVPAERPVEAADLGGEFVRHAHLSLQRVLETSHHLHFPCSIAAVCIHNQFCIGYSGEGIIVGHRSSLRNRCL